MVVVTLGHRLTSDVSHPHLRRRVDAGIAALEATNAQTIVFTGGKTTSGVRPTESEAMLEYAADCGVDRARIRLENRALDTIGNGYFTRRLVEDLAYDVETVSLVSADYHVERAAYVFEQCFGADYEVDVARGVETSIPSRRRHEARRLEAAREFFDPIDPGDVDAIERRLYDVHDLYDADEPVRTRASSS